MTSLTKKFNLTANQDIFDYGTIKSDIGLVFGDHYLNKLNNHESIIMSVDLICDSEVQWQVRCIYGRESAWQDLIGGSVLSLSSYPISQLIPSAPVTGTVTFKLA